jgi:predicted GIY-YIG superfamily endonuclease
MHHIYILLCSDSSYYIGHTTNVKARLKAHNEGRGAAHTFKHRPVVLVFTEAHPTKLTAIRRERQLKRWTRAKKEALIRGDLDLLHKLSRRQN